MLDNNINYLVGKKISHSQNVIFDPLIMDFLSEIGSELKKNKKIFQLPDLFFLMIWCSKKNLETYFEKYKKSSFRVGRGTVFHISPSNVPINFFYSFAFGLLSGNSNIVKLPSKDYLETNILIKIIKKIIIKKKYAEIKKSNIFIKYKRSKIFNDFFTKKSDVRIIWGGDNTINEVRNSKLNVKSFELVFPDRYSLSLINLDKLETLNAIDFQKLVKSFFYDSFTMKQQACNSPHFVFWLGKKNESIINKFWTTLSDIAKKQSNFSLIDITDKYSHICNQFIKFENLKNFNNFNNYVYVSDYKKQYIDDLRGLNGIFYQKFLKNINNLKKSITSKCQTITYFGFQRENLQKFIIKNKIKGIDRIVPLGQSMNIDLIWDGFDMIKSLSRIIDIK